jgi:hypothetical protein
MVWGMALITRPDCLCHHAGRTSLPFTISREKKVRFSLFDSRDGTQLVKARTGFRIQGGESRCISKHSEVQMIAALQQIVACRAKGCDAESAIKK